MISTSTRYALRALVHLQRAHASGPLLARDVADATSIPRPFLAKILQRLAQVGLVHSQKGPGGGFTLGREAAEITVAQVMTAMDGVPRDPTCVLGRPECSHEDPCPMHDALASIRRQFDATIGCLSLAQIDELDHEGDRHGTVSPR